MIKFPETAWAEWTLIANAEKADGDLRKKIERDTLVERETERLRIRHEAGLRFQQELDADITPKLEMFTLATYKQNPANTPADLIDGVLKDNGLCIALGPSGAGKSTTALQMIHSLATGDDWFGQQATQISGGFGLLSYDMDGSLMSDWLAGFPNLDPDRVSVVNAHKQGNPLGVPEFRKQIAETWRSMAVEVVVLDSFSASFFGPDQNDAAATMAHYRFLKQFALTEVGARVLIVIVHSTKDKPGQARGSSVHQDVADTMLTVYKHPKTDARHVEMVKYRAGRGQQEMSPVIVTDADPVTHLSEVDLGAMSLAGLPLPSRLKSLAAFAASAPIPHNPPVSAASGDDEFPETADDDLGSYGFTPYNDPEFDTDSDPLMGENDEGEQDAR